MKKLKGKKKFTKSFSLKKREICKNNVKNVKKILKNDSQNHENNDEKNDQTKMAQKCQKM